MLVLLGFGGCVYLFGKAMDSSHQPQKIIVEIPGILKEKK